MGREASLPPSSPPAIYSPFVVALRPPHRSVRLNVELDHAKRAKWSPDNRALVLCTAVANRVHVYRVKRREDGSPGTAEPLLQFRDAHRSSELLNVGIACNGLFIMSISMDTTLCVWSLKGTYSCTRRRETRGTHAHVVYIMNCC
ncbi:hypothetical protein HPB48_026639 [Haemaphysalis longicornis]|uniref:Uncharacterized protein n=1 Tax=Haemaphysalis longicornis TaxID=44386 RepID=A0A9J6HA04_HAELO|nr:hypothetical protein HPB48_026639 [Haemaphysalis longicornis]